MKILDRLERKFGRYAIPNVTVGLLVMQVAAWMLSTMQVLDLNQLLLWRDAVLRGEVWRLLAFLAYPPITNPVFLIFAWYLFYLMGTALEGFWGDFRYNVFIFVSWLATVLVSFIVPWPPATNAYIGGSIFLAFAYLNPDFVLLLMFILPVKVKWLAMITWIVYVYQFATGDWATRLDVLAAASSFMLFFGAEVWTRMRYGARSMAFDARRFGLKGEPFHRCVVCGATDRSHPHMQFLYCSQCDGAPCYCEDHINAHEHVKAQA